MNVVTGKENGGGNPSVSQMMNFSIFSRYKASTLEDYQAKIASMNLSDLHRHAIELGIKPSSDRKRMAQALSSQYLKDKSKYDLAVLKSKGEEVQIEDKKTKLKYPIF